MCIAILNLKSRLTAETLTNSWNNNNEGAGLLWNEAGSLQTFKTYKLSKLTKKYNQLRNNPDIGKIVLHFRIATSGHEKFTNLHPFLVNDKLGFVHNGVISGLGNKVHSDTYQFNEILKGLPANFLSNDSHIQLIEKYVGHSKLIFLDSSDNHTIINEHAGQWIADTWFSNNSYDCELSYVYYGNQKVSKKAADPNPYDWWEEKQYRDIDNNYSYFYTHWKDASPLSIDKALQSLQKDIADPDIYETFEELSYHFNTSRLLQLIERIEQTTNDERTVNLC